MQFSTQSWQVIQPIYQRILQHPFLIELAQGTLAQDIFIGYLQQDALYLADFARALALASVKATNKADFIGCLDFAKAAVFAEQEVHTHFLQQFEMKAVTQKSLACLAYTQFLLTTAALDSFAEMIAAILPCFWIYRAVGRHIAWHTVKNNPYATWIAMYAGDAFDASVEQAIDLMDRAATQASGATLTRMTQLLITASELEFAFWDSAYRRDPMIFG